MFETTNKDLRGKWEEDIKTFGVELEAVNKQLLKERSRNDDLEHLMKVKLIVFKLCCCCKRHCNESLPFK